VFIRYLIVEDADHPGTEDAPPATGAIRVSVPAQRRVPVHFAKIAARQAGTPMLTAYRRSKAAA
jgi:hypothetical protein